MYRLHKTTTDVISYLNESVTCAKGHYVHQNVCRRLRIWE